MYVFRTEATPKNTPHVLIRTCLYCTCRTACARISPAHYLHFPRPTAIKRQPFFFQVLMQKVLMAGVCHGRHPMRSGLFSSATLPTVNIRITALAEFLAIIFGSLAISGGDKGRRSFFSHVPSKYTAGEMPCLFFFRVPQLTGQYIPGMLCKTTKARNRNPSFRLMSVSQHESSTPLEIFFLVPAHRYLS